MNNNILDNLDDKYKYDVDILSISFNYYKDDDSVLDPPNDLQDPPKLIITGRSAKFEQPQGFVGYYYFKLIFINPSTYNIHVKTRGVKDGPSISTIETTPIKNYSYIMPFTCEMLETQIAPNHYKWEIYFIHNDAKEGGYIKIYADSLEIEDLDHNPFVNY